eukprot:347464-Chlamydomonas_euryale.AAC.2
MGVCVRPVRGGRQETGVCVRPVRGGHQERGREFVCNREGGKEEARTTVTSESVLSQEWRGRGIAKRVENDAI